MQIPVPGFGGDEVSGNLTPVTQERDPTRLRRASTAIVGDCLACGRDVGLAESGYDRTVLRDIPQQALASRRRRLQPLSATAFSSRCIFVSCLSRSDALTRVASPPTDVVTVRSHPSTGVSTMI
jgi:hypothetical protein